MKSRIFICFVLACAGLFSLGGEAYAKPNAGEKFNEGLRLFQAGQHEKAADAFYEAYRAHPHAAALYNAGLAWQLAGDPGRAATAYSLALEMKLGEAARADARHRLDDLSRSLGRIEVGAPDGSTIRSPPFMVHRSSAVLYLSPGRHRIDVKLESGAWAVRRVVAVAGQTTVVLVEATSSEEDPEAVPEPKARPPKGRAGPAEPPDKTLGYIALGAAAVAAGTATVLGIEALRARDDFDASGHTSSTARDRAETYRLWTNIAWVSAAAFGAAGTVYLIMSDDDPATGSRITGVGVRGAF